MQFKSVIIAVVIGTTLVVGGLLVNSARPPVQTAQPGPEYIRATGKCAQCHSRETAAVVHQFARSKHSRVGITCFDCHRPVEGQTPIEHNGQMIAVSLTAANCKQCHQTEYDQFERSRHAAPSWAAVAGSADFTPDQIKTAEAAHPGTVNRPANALAIVEGMGVLEKGCEACHSIGRPNADGTIGTCTQCHSRHSGSIELARIPQTCGQCHMGPDHSQLEIYAESKHGVLFEAQQTTMNLSASPKLLTTRDMPVPTCATCHMSGLEGLKVTHDVTERLSYYLFAPISKKRDHYSQGQREMQEVCLKCHAKGTVETFYSAAEEVVVATNAKIAEGLALVQSLRDEGLLTAAPFDQPIDFKIFDLWHYYGRTAKHGAFMGGADFVQWHGNYEILLTMVELEAMAKELRAGH